MRYIPLNERVPGDTLDEARKVKIEQWLAKADDLRKQLEDAPDEIARKKIIDAHDDFWGEIKEWLLSLSYNKCWFTEAHDTVNHWHVEHFRPKNAAKNIDGTQDEGYWWLAFDWHNYRITGSVVNAKKLTYFPLKSGCARIHCNGDVRGEEPLLLDPADPNDPLLISFEMTGDVILSPGIDDEWEKVRVEYSIDRYNLNGYPPLVDKRKLVWSDCWNLIRQYQEELANYQSTKSQFAHEMFKEKIRRIRRMIGPEIEFSSVARSCIMSSGDRRIINIIQSN